MSYQPELASLFPTQQASSGNVTNAILCKCPVAGNYSVRYYLDTSAIGAVGAVGLSITWTHGGTTRTTSPVSLSLASLAGVMMGVLPLMCDAGSQITYSLAVTGTSGAFSLNMGVRPPG